MRRIHTWAHRTCREFVSNAGTKPPPLGPARSRHTFLASCSCGAALTWRSLRGARLTGPLQASRASTWSSRHALPGCRDGNVSTRSHPPPTPPLCAHIGFEESAILCPLRCRSHRTSSTSWCIDTCMSQVRIAHHWCKFCEMASAQTASHERRHTHDHPPPPRSVHRRTAPLTRALRLQVSGTPPSLSALRAWSPRATSTAPRSRRAS